MFINVLLCLPCFPKDGLLFLHLLTFLPIIPCLAFSSRLWYSSHYFNIGLLWLEVCILRTLKYLWGRIYWDMGTFKLLAQFIRTTSNYKLWQNSHFTKRQMSFYYTADGSGIYILYIIHSNTQKRWGLFKYKTRWEQTQ